MRRICPKCGDDFEPEEKYYYLCSTGENDCYHELGVFGDSVREKFWASLGEIMNSKAPREDLEALSDSPAWHKFLFEVLDEMDFKSREQLFVKIGRTYIKGLKQ